MQTAADELTTTTRKVRFDCSSCCCKSIHQAAVAHAASAQACYSLPAGTHPPNALAAADLLSGADWFISEPNTKQLARERLC
jgi:hypothetical protein